MTGDPVPSIPLNTGASIPQVGLGTWPLDDAEVERAIVQAVEVGYRHIDTAEKYGNEVGVGRGIRAAGIDRSELFVTTKLDGKFQGDDRAIRGLEESLGRLDLDYVDLLLIHWPLPQRDQFVSTWRTFEKLHERGLARAIGTSNFSPQHLKTLMAQTSVVPAVNQVQLSPQVPRGEERAFHEEHAIVTVAWSPLGGGNELLQHEMLRQIAEEHGVSPAQVVLRWHVQQGIVPIPKSKTPERMRANLDVFAFELTDADMLMLDRLIGGEHVVDPDSEGH